MEILKVYGQEDFGNLVGILARAGLRCLTWAELDQNNNIIYLVQLPKPNPVVEEPAPQRQVLNETLDDENGNKE